MAGAGGKISMKVLTIAIGIPVGIAMRKATNRAFSVARPEGGDREVEDSGADWRDILIWAAVSGVGVAATQIITRKGAEETFRIISGNEPPPQPLSKKQKKALKQQEKQQEKQDAKR